jgi:threonine dehydratase
MRVASAAAFGYREAFPQQGFPMTIPTIADIARARDRIAGEAVRTPLLFSPFLSERLSARVYLKPESLQRTGSFKFRGAYNALSALPPETRARGVVAISSGNHAQGVAEAARLFGVPATILMPTDAPRLKRMRTERSGARVVDFDRATEDREVVAARAGSELGGAFIHPFDDPFVIAGQGTVGLEIADDASALGIAPEIVMVPASGGGLTAGVTLAVTDRFPGVAVYAAEPEGFDDYARSLKAGSPQRNSKSTGSISDALLVPEPGRIGWEINRTRLAGAVVASDPETLVAVGLAFDELRLVVEPGGAVGLAALLAGRLEIAGRTIVIVLSGGNIADDMLAAGIAAYRAGESGRKAKTA